MYISNIRGAVGCIINRSYIYTINKFYMIMVIKVNPGKLNTTKVNPIFTKMIKIGIFFMGL